MTSYQNKNILAKFYSKLQNCQWNFRTQPANSDKMSSHDQDNVDTNVKLKEKWISETLSPMEPMVMSLQSLLVWENPKKSALLFTIVHISFWFLAYISSRFYFLIFASLLVIFFVDTWKKKIWPEIRVPPPVPEDDEDWISVHPRLLSTPEISRHIAQALHVAQTTLRRWRVFRRTHPHKFSFFTISFFTTLFLVSRCISGLTLTYTLVMSVLLWPCVMYHDLLKKGYLYMEPVFMWLDYQLKHFKVAKVEEKKEVKEEPVTDRPTAVVTDVVEEFCPSYDPETTAALARAITDSEDEGGTSSAPTPGLSKEPSIDDSDDDREVNADDLMPSIDQMPSFDDLDHTDDEWSPGSPSDRSGSIHFTPEHYGDESDSDDDNFGEVSIPGDLDRGAEQLITQALVSQTLTNMMENALQSLRPDDESSSFSSGMLPRSGTKITYTKTSQGESFDISDPADDTIIEEEEENEGTDAENIEKEFDFLDDYDEEDSKKK